MIRRLIASLLVVSLAVLTPGGRFYEACAQVVAVPGAGSSAATAASSVISLSLPLAGAGAVSLPAASFSPSLTPSLVAAPSPISLSGAVLSAPSHSPFIPGAVAVNPSPSSPFIIKALKPSLPAAAVPSTALTSSPSPASSTPASFKTASTGEESAALFDQSVVRPAALDPVLPAASSEDTPPPASLEAAKTPAASEPGAEPPAPRAKLPRSMWGLFWGHHITTVFGVNFHMLSQPFLVKDALGMGTATMGLVRNIHMGSMAVVNFLPIGYLIDKTDYRVVFIATSLARALLMAAIPLLFMAGGLHFSVLALIVAVNPIFQSTMIVADGAARKSFLGKDEKLNKDAAATLGKWDSVAGAVMPIVAGWAIGLLVTGLGLGGYAMAYGVYAALLLASVPIYLAMVRDPRFPEHDRLTPARFVVQTATFFGALVASVATPFTAILTWSYRSFFEHERALFPAGRALASLAWTGRELLVSLAGALLLPFALLKALAKLPAAVKAARASRADGAARPSLADRLEAYKPTQGLAFILKNRTLKILTMVMALEVLLIDALPFVVIPSLITDAVGSAPAALSLPLWAPLAVAGAALAAVAAKGLKLAKSWRPALVLGSLAAAVAGVWAFPGLLLTQVATAGGVMGLLFSVEYVGRFLPSVRLEGEKGDAIIDKKGHGSFYRKAAVASLLFWALLIPAFVTTGMFWLNLAIVGAVLFGVQYFNTPVGIVLEPVKRAQMDDDKLARIESAVFMVDVAFESVGALLLGLLLDFAGLKAALIAVALFLTLTGVLQYQVPKWIFPDGNRPAKTAPPEPKP